MLPPDEPDFADDLRGPDPAWTKHAAVAAMVAGILAVAVVVLMRGG